MNFLGEEIGVEHLLDAQTGKGGCSRLLPRQRHGGLGWRGLFGPGIQTTQRGVLKLLQRFDLDTRIQATVDFKSKLHEWGQKRKRKVQFKVVREFKREGQQLYQDASVGWGQGDGHVGWPSKKSAEQAAAREACRHIFGDD